MMIYFERTFDVGCEGTSNVSRDVLWLSYRITSVDLDLANGWNLLITANATLRWFIHSSRNACESAESRVSLFRRCYVINEAAEIIRMAEFPCRGQRKSSLSLSFAHYRRKLSTVSHGPWSLRREFSSTFLTQLNSTQSYANWKNRGHDLDIEKSMKKKKTLKCEQKKNKASTLLTFDLELFFVFLLSQRNQSVVISRIIKRFSWSLFFSLERTARASDRASDHLAANKIASPR